MGLGGPLKFLGSIAVYEKGRYYCKFRGLASQWPIPLKWSSAMESTALDSTPSIDSAGKRANMETAGQTHQEASRTMASLVSAKKIINIGIGMTDGCSRQLKLQSKLRKWGDIISETWWSGCGKINKLSWETVLFSGSQEGINHQGIGLTLDKDA